MLTRLLLAAIFVFATFLPFLSAADHNRENRRPIPNSEGVKYKEKNRKQKKSRKQKQTRCCSYLFQLDWHYQSHE